MTWKLASSPCQEPGNSSGIVWSGLFPSQSVLARALFLPGLFLLSLLLVIYVPRIQTFPLTSQPLLDQSRTQANRCEWIKPITPTRQLTLTPYPEGSGWASWPGVRKDAEKVPAEVKGGKVCTVRTGRWPCVPGGSRGLHQATQVQLVNGERRRALHDSGVLTRSSADWGTHTVHPAPKHLFANLLAEGLVRLN